MAEYINRYFRDNKELPLEEWLELFNEDMKIAADKSEYAGFCGSVITDRSNGRPCRLNNHIYTQREDVKYESAVEVIDHMLAYDTDALVKAIEKLPDGAQQILVLNIERVKKIDDKFVVEDVKW